MINARYYCSRILKGIKNRFLPAFNGGARPVAHRPSCHPIVTPLSISKEKMPTHVYDIASVAWRGISRWGGRTRRKITYQILHVIFFITFNKNVLFTRSTMYENKPRTP